MLLSSSPSMLYHNFLPLSRLQTSWHPGYGENFSVIITLLNWPTKVSNISGVGRVTRIYKTFIGMEVTIGGDAAKSGKNTNLIVIIHVRL